MSVDFWIALIVLRRTVRPARRRQRRALGSDPHTPLTTLIGTSTNLVARRSPQRPRPHSNQVTSVVILIAFG